MSRFDVILEVTEKVEESEAEAKKAEDEGSSGV